MQINTSHSPAYDRLLLIFVCLNDGCNNQCSKYKVFRCLIKKENFSEYSNETAQLSIFDASKNGLLSISETGSSMENLINMLTDLKVSNNADNNKLRKPKTKAVTHTELIQDNIISQKILPCYELDFEEEDYNIDDLINTSSETNSTNKSSVVVSDVCSDDEIDDSLLDREEDDILIRFNNHLKLCPNQVLRYEYGGKPLWLTTSNLKGLELNLVLSKRNPPNCPLCGSLRVFECQVIGTILSIVTEHDPKYEEILSRINFSVLFVFSCKNDCIDFKDTNIEFIEELLIFQSI